MPNEQATVPELIVHRRFDAPIERVWQAWVQPEAIAAWLGPKGTETHVIESNIVTGGVLRSRMDMNGQSMFAAFFYREVTPPSRLVYEHCFADAQGAIVRPPFFEVWPLKLLTTVTFEPDAGGTRVQVSWRPLDATPEEHQAFAEQFASMNGGWAMSFDQLAEYLGA